MNKDELRVLHEKPKRINKYMNNDNSWCDFKIGVGGTILNSNNAYHEYELVRFSILRLI